jgi:hypothetical protein
VVSGESMWFTFAANFKAVARAIPSMGEGKVGVSRTIIQQTNHA